MIFIAWFDIYWPFWRPYNLLVPHSTSLPFLLPVFCRMFPCTLIWTVVVSVPFSCMGYIHTLYGGVAADDLYGDSYSFFTFPGIIRYQPFILGLDVLGYITRVVAPFIYL